MARHRWGLAGLGFALLAAVAGARAQEGGLVHVENMQALHCAMPTAATHFAGSNAPGQIFGGDEAVTLKLVLAKGQEGGDYRLEIQEIGTRTPGKVVQGMAGFSDTAGHAPIVDLIGKPVQHPFTVTVDPAAKETPVEVANVAVPKRFGTYAVVLCHGDQRQFLCTLARVPAPRPYGTPDNTPIFGEGNFVGGRNLEERALIFGRMGIRGWRSELTWCEREDGSVDWANYDRLFKAADAAGCKIMITLGGMGGWQWPWKVTQTPAGVAGRLAFIKDENPYWGQCDWLCGPELYSRYEKWIAALCARYYDGGKGALWGLENYNEPWEGGGISGWARDCIQYREIQRTIARAARSVSPNIRLLAASSIMNTEDKLFSDDSKEFEQYVDIFTDHYVVPAMCYGPMVAKAHGKKSMETETWFVGTEYQLPQGVAQFTASGQEVISPWHPRALFDNIPGGTDSTVIPTPVVAATAAFNYFVTGKHFEKVVFRDHLPWVFQYGKDDDKGAMLVMFGQLIPIGGDDPKEVLWSQVNGAGGGTMTIDNHDGLLKFYDLAGNPDHVGEATVTLPLSYFPSYIACDQGPVAAAARLAQMTIAGKRPVEILPRDFSTRLSDPKAALVVGVHNCLNRPLSGTLTVTAPADVTLAAAAQPVTLAAGETKQVSFAITKAMPNAANAYPFAFSFAAGDQVAKYAENLSVCVVPKATIDVSGSLDQWKDIPGVALAVASKLHVTVKNTGIAAVQGTLTVTPAPASGFKLATAAVAVPVSVGPGATFATDLALSGATKSEVAPADIALSFAKADGSAADATLQCAVGQKLVNGSPEDATELLRRPWLAIQQADTAATSGWLKMAYDEHFLYLAAQVNDATAEKVAPHFAARDENHYFHTAADDQEEPFKSFLEKPRIKQADGTLKSLKDLGHSFGEVPYVYARSPEANIPFRRDRLQFGLDVTPDWHDLTADTDRVPEGFHVVPDTDYEYSLYLCDDGQGELWRHLAPGVPRIHDFPRQPRGAKTTGLVPGAKYVVKREGTLYTYLLAIPASELATLKLTAGTAFGFAWKIGNSAGDNVESGRDKAVCKSNGLTLHPYWERSPSCGVRWTLE